MQREGQQVTGRGDYILSTDRSSFTNARLWLTYHGIDHRMILVVLQGEGALCNPHYQWGRTHWPIQLKAVQPHTKGESAFADIKGEITRTLRLKDARSSWISQETWTLVDRRSALHRAQ